MIVFITTGYNENVIGGSDLWVSNFIDNIFPLIKEPFALLIDGRPYIKKIFINYIHLIMMEKQMLY